MAGTGGGRRGSGAGSDRTLESALHAGRRAYPICRSQHRHQPVPRRQPGVRRPDAQRRRRPVPVQGGRAQHLSLLYRVAHPGRQGAAGHRTRLAPRPGGGRVRPALSAPGGHAGRRAPRRGGPGALAAARPGADRAGPLHPHRRGYRPDRSPRRMGVARRLRPGARLAGCRPARHDRGGEPVAMPVPRSRFGGEGAPDTGGNPPAARLAGAGNHRERGHGAG
jgi:hypothetical protein